MTAALGGLFARPNSTARPFAAAAAWLWRLGPVCDEPKPGCVGVGELREAAELHVAVKEHRLAGAVVLAGSAGPEVGPVPGRRQVSGVGTFAPGASVGGDFIVFDSGRPLVRTRLGDHAVRDDRFVAIGLDPVGQWGRLSVYWALEAVQGFLVDVLDRPLLQLPPVGCIRLDDMPGTAQHQLEGRAKSDRRVRRRIERLLVAYRRAGAKLSVAVAARALRNGRLVPSDDVWPEAVAVLARGVEEGVFEPVCHGLLHYDSEASREGHVEPREFASLDRAEAGRRLDLALDWLRRRLGDPRTFVAPAWGYSPGALAAAAERGLPAWHRAAPEPLIVDGNPRETLIGAGGVGGVHRLDYQALVHLARAGVPPTLALHGGLLDDRLVTRRVRRDVLAYARLLYKRDAVRLAFVDEVRWIGAGELVDRLLAHDESEVRGGAPILPEGAEAVLISAEGRRVVRG